MTPSEDGWLCPRCGAHAPPNAGRCPSCEAPRRAAPAGFCPWPEHPVVLDSWMLKARGGTALYRVEQDGCHGYLLRSARGESFLRAGTLLSLGVFRLLDADV